MGTIVARQRQNGSTAYMAKITLKREGKVIHREAKTFDRRAAAVSWVTLREDELAKPGAVDLAKVGHPTLADAIDKYTGDSRKKIGKTKTQVLRSLKEFEIAGMKCEKIGSAEIIALAKELSKGREPSTVGNYLSHLGAIFAVARPAWGYPLDPQAMKDALIVTRRLGLTGKSKERDRRPTLDELNTVMTHYGDRQRRRPTMAPMQRLVAFAIFSTRRQEEIARIKWADLDEENSRVMVRDMKNPGEKEGNDVWCDLPEQAMQIIKAMPRTEERIFPYSADSISASFTRACQFLDIDDLHFHDLRHDGVSRLFELGWNIPHVAAVSGHRSWTSLKRYTHIKQRGDKYAGWKWLPTVTPQPQPQHTPTPDHCSGEP